MNKGLKVAWAVRGKCAGSVWKVHGKCVGSAWEMCGKCTGSVGDFFLEVVGSAELSANTCRTARYDVSRKCYLTQTSAAGH